jgi:hypothetical protein
MAAKWDESILFGYHVIDRSIDPSRKNVENVEKIAEEIGEDVLMSSSSWKLRQQVVEGVMTAYPILQAVHASSDATPVEM